MSGLEDSDPRSFGRDRVDFNSLPIEGTPPVLNRITFTHLSARVKTVESRSRSENTRLSGGDSATVSERKAVCSDSVLSVARIRNPNQTPSFCSLGNPDSTVRRLVLPLALSGGIFNLAMYGSEDKDETRNTGDQMQHLEELSNLIHSGERFGAILIDPPWRFRNLTGKVGPEHRRLYRYSTMSLEEIAALPIEKLAAEKSHIYLWCPNALLLEGLSILKVWGFDYKTNIVWFKVRKDGGPDGRGVGFYFRNVTELLLFGSRGSLRTLKPGRTQVNIVIARKQEHSRKPEAVYDLIQRCSPGPYLELFARERVSGWVQWGDEVDSYKLKKPPQIQLKLSRS